LVAAEDLAALAIEQHDASAGREDEDHHADDLEVAPLERALAPELGLGALAIGDVAEIAAALHVLVRRRGALADREDLDVHDFAVLRPEAHLAPALSLADDALEVLVEGADVLGDQQVPHFAADELLLGHPEPSHLRLVGVEEAA